MLTIHYSGYQTYVSGIITQGGGTSGEHFVTTYKVSTSIATNMSEFESSQVFVMNENGSQVIAI